MLWPTKCIGGGGGGGAGFREGYLSPFPLSPVQLSCLVELLLIAHYSLPWAPQPRCPLCKHASRLAFLLLFPAPQAIGPSHGMVCSFRRRMLP